MICIRKAHLKDVDTLIVLQNELFHNQIESIKNSGKRNMTDLLLKKDVEDILKKFIHRMILSTKGLVLIAEVDNIVAGYLIIVVKKNIPIFDLEILGEITDLYIREDFRGRGISKKLRNKAFEWCKLKNISTVTVNVFPENINARRIYEKWGFHDFFLEMRMRI